MNTQSSGFLKFVTLLCAVLLALALPLALLAFDVWRVVFNPPVIKDFITDEVVNSDLVATGLGWFSERRAQERVAKGEALTGVNEPDIVLLLSYLTIDDWKKIKSELLTKEFLTHLVSVTVDGTYNWIDSNDKVPPITWDLQPLIERVKGENGKNVVALSFSKLPPCKEQEIADFLARLSKAPPGVQVLYNLCQFPKPWGDDQFQDYLDAVLGVAKNIPTKFAFTEELLRVATGGGVGPEALKAQLRNIRMAAQWAWILPLTFLLLILGLGVRSVSALGRWVGIPLIIGGALSLLPVLVYRALITSTLASGVLSETPALIKNEVMRVIIRAADLVFQPLIWQAGIVVGVGILLLVWMFVTQRRAPAQS